MPCGPHAGAPNQLHVALRGQVNEEGVLQVGRMAAGSPGRCNTGAVILVHLQPCPPTWLQKCNYTALLKSALEYLPSSPCHVLATGRKVSNKASNTNQKMVVRQLCGK